MNRRRSLGVSALLSIVIASFVFGTCCGSDPGPEPCVEGRPKQDLVGSYLSVLRDTADKLDPTGVKAALEMYKAELARTKCITKAIDKAQADLAFRSRDAMPVYEFEWKASGYSHLVLTVVAKDNRDVVLATPLFFKNHLDEQKKVADQSGLLVLSQRWFRENGLERGKEYLVVARFEGMDNPARHPARSQVSVRRRVLSSDGTTIPEMLFTLGPSNGTREFPLVWNLPEQR